MREIDRIRDQLRRSIEGPAWHGPSLMEVLEGLDCEGANERPIPKAHSVAELVPHIVTWMDVVRHRLRGDWAPVSDSKDFPRPATTVVEWSAAITRLRAAAEALDRALAEAPDSALEQNDPEGGFPLLLHLDGVVQHNLYHAGQIAMLRKGITP